MAFIDPKPQICHMCHDMRRRLSRSNDIHALGAVLLHALAQVLALADIDAAFALAHRCAVFFGSSAKIVFASQVNTIIQLAHKSNPANRETSAELQAALSREALTFSVDNINSGSAASIQNQKMTDFVTWPADNRALEIGNSTTHLTDRTVEPTLVFDVQRADPHWTSAGSGPSYDRKRSITSVNHGT